LQASPDDIDVSALWQAVKRNRLRLLAAVLATGAITFATLSAMPPLYRSSAQIILSRDASIYTRPRAEQQPSAESLRIDQDEISSQVEVIQSADALQRIIASLQLEKRPEFNSALRSSGPITGVLRILGLADADRKLPEQERVFNAFRKNLVVYPVAKSHVIAIEFTSTDSKLAADIANAVASAYIESNRLEQLRRDSDATSWIGSRIDELKQEAAEAESALERFRAQAGLLAGQNNVTLNTQQLSELNTQLTQARAQLAEAGTRAAEVRAMLAQGDIESSPDVMRSPVMQRLLEQKVAAERDVAELSATLLPKHPRMLQVSSKLAKLKAEIRREAVKIVKSLEKEAEISASRVRAIEASMAGLTEKAEQSSDAQAKLSGLERAAKSKRELYDTYLDRFNEASTRDQRSVPAYARQIARAMPSGIPDFPKTIPSTLLAMAGMALAGLGLVVTRELMHAARSGRILAGAVLPPGRPVPEPAMPRRRQTPEPVVSEESSLGDIAQRLIQRTTAQGGQRTAVTAPPGRSDTARTALRIAEALAKSGRSVLVIDAGADGPSLADAASIPSTVGWRELLAGEASFEDVLTTRGEGGVHLIPAGGRAILAFGAEARERLQLCLEALSETYEQILIVASAARLRPLLPLLDSAIEISDAEDDAAAASLGGAGVEVIRYRAKVTVPDRLRARFSRGTGATA
jgi:uncharacterized protein involved in exopolysaccharide biosynthesis